MENLEALDQPELTLELTGRHPEEIPLGRLAEYMGQFAKLLGDDSDVHFSEVRDGSICIVAKASDGAGQSLIKDRVLKAIQGEGPKRPVQAYRKLCLMSAQDGLPASVCADSDTIAKFPASQEQTKKRLYRGHWMTTGQIRGVLSVADGSVRVTVRPLDGGPLVRCSAPEDVGHSLASSFMKNVRIEGQAMWTRSDDGEWRCDNCEAERVREVKDVTLKEVITKIWSLPIEWDDDPFPENGDGRTT